MRFSFVIILMAITKLSFCQCDNRSLFEYYTEPTIDENGQLFIAFDLKDKIDSACKVDFISLGGELEYMDKEKKIIILNDVLPFKNSGKSVEFYIGKNITSLPKEIKNYQWTQIKLHLNYKLNGTMARTEELRYINQQYFKDSKNKISLKSFVKNAKTKKVVLGLEIDRSINKIENIEISNGQMVLGQAEGKDIDSRNNTFIIKCQTGFEECLQASIKYNIKVYYSDILGTQNSMSFNDMSLSQKNDFTINKEDVSGNMVYGNEKTSVKARTSLHADNLFVTLNPSPYTDGKLFSKVKFSRESGTNEYEFDIASNDIFFKPGKYELSFSGTDADKNEMETVSTFYFQKVQPAVSALKAEFNSTNGESKYKVKFSQPLPKTAKVELKLIGSSEIPFKMIPVPDQTEYNFTFSYGDITIDNYLKYIDTNKKEIPIQFFVDDIAASPQYLAPLKINTKAALQKQMEDQLTKKEKKDKIAIRKFLEDKQVQGDLDKAADLAVQEFGKDKEKRDWSNVWSKIVKVAPSVLGAVTLLL
jgi:hypothetical protein